MDMEILIISMVSAGIGAVGKTFGDRMKFLHEERKDQRDLQISEKDLWFKLGSLDQKIESLTSQLHEARAESAKLQVQVAVLRSENDHIRAQHQDLSQRYDLLRASHDNLLRGGPPDKSLELPLEGPSPGPSSVPEGGAP